MRTPRRIWPLWISTSRTTSDGYSIAVKKGNTELAEFINGVLAELKEQNAIEQFIVEAKKLESAAE